VSNYVLCIDNSSPDALIVGKIYRCLPDEAGSRLNLLRVVDETFGEPGSEDGYLYPAKMFLSIDLPEKVQRAYADATGQPMPSGSKYGNPTQNHFAE
jgi:hypothetical protein